MVLHVFLFSPLVHISYSVVDVNALSLSFLHLCLPAFSPPLIFLEKYKHWKMYSTLPFPGPISRFRLDFHASYARLFLKKKLFPR